MGIAVGFKEGLVVGTFGVKEGLIVGEVVGRYDGLIVGDNGKQHEIALGGGQLLTRLGAVTSAAGQLLDEQTPIVVG